MLSVIPSHCAVTFIDPVVGSEIRPLDSTNVYIAFRIKTKMEDIVLCHL